MHLIVKKSDEFGKPFHQKFAKLEVSFFLSFLIISFSVLVVVVVYIKKCS